MMPQKLHYQFLVKFCIRTYYRVFIDTGAGYTEKLTFIRDNWFYLKHQGTITPIMEKHHRLFHLKMYSKLRQQMKRANSIY